MVPLSLIKGRVSFANSHELLNCESGEGRGNPCMSDDRKSGGLKNVKNLQHWVLLSLYFSAFFLITSLLWKKMTKFAILTIISVQLSGINYTQNVA